MSKVPMTDEQVAKAVAEYGWQAIGVSDCDAPFVYTCGLMTTFNHPELIIFDPDPEVGYAILDAMAEQVRNRRSFATPGEYDDVLVDVPIAVRPVHPTQHEIYLGHAMGHCRHTGKPGTLSAMQVFWPDAEGRFPFERECDESTYRAQPRIDLALTQTEIEEFRSQWSD